MNQHILNVIKYFVFHNSFLILLFISHISLCPFKCPSFIFCYCIFYGKTALQPISYVVKMIAAKMLAVKVLRTMSIMGDM